MSPNRTENVLLLGDPRLRFKCPEVTKSDFENDEFNKQLDLLKTTLTKFRLENGFGRAIAGPQIGLMKRVIMFCLNEKYFCAINPKIIARSDETFTVWDDCFSLPDLLCKVKRNKNVTVEYYDNSLDEATILENLEPALSELFQHEIDHLDGVLMVDRLENGVKDMIYRDLYLKDATPYNLMVDFYYEKGELKPSVH
jgi:peptide deformylase